MNIGVGLPRRSSERRPPSLVLPEQVVRRATGRQVVAFSARGATDHAARSPLPTVRR